MSIKFVWQVELSDMPEWLMGFQQSGSEWETFTHSFFLLINPVMQKIFFSETNRCIIRLNRPSDSSTQDVPPKIILIRDLSNGQMKRFLIHALLWFFGVFTKNTHYLQRDRNCSPSSWKRVFTARQISHLLARCKRFQSTTNWKSVSFFSTLSSTK